MVNDAAAGTAGMTELDRLHAEREKLNGFRKQAAEELMSATGTAVFDLRKEIVRLDDRLRMLNVAIFKSEKRIKRGVKPREVCCPTCERYLPAGTILSEAVIEKLKAAGYGGLMMSEASDKKGL